MESVIISKTTLEILKNFSTISGNILFEKDQEYLKVMAPLKNVFGHAKIEERFPQEFSILELANFNEALSMFAIPKLTFMGEYVIISNESGQSDIKYYQTDKKFIQVNEKPYRDIASVESFKLTETMLNSIMKATGIIGGDTLSFVGDGTDLTALVSEKGERTNSASNKFKTTVGKTPNKFNIDINTKNLKVIPKDYTCHIVLDADGAQPRIVRLISDDANLIYTFAVEKDSTYEH